MMEAADSEENEEVGEEIDSEFDQVRSEPDESDKDEQSTSDKSAIEDEVDSSIHHLLGEISFSEVFEKVENILDILTTEENNGLRIENWLRDGLKVVTELYEQLRNRNELMGCAARVGCEKSVYHYIELGRRLEKIHSDSGDRININSVIWAYQTSLSLMVSVLAISEDTNTSEIRLLKSGTTKTLMGLKNEKKDLLDNLGPDSDSQNPNISYLLSKCILVGKVWDDCILEQVMQNSEIKQSHIAEKEIHKENGLKNSFKNLFLFQSAMLLEEYFATMEETVSVEGAVRCMLVNKLYSLVGETFTVNRAQFYRQKAEDIQVRLALCDFPESTKVGDSIDPVLKRLIAAGLKVSKNLRELKIQALTEMPQLQIEELEKQWGAVKQEYLRLCWEGLCRDMEVVVENINEKPDPYAAAGELLEKIKRLSGVQDVLKFLPNSEYAQLLSQHTHIIISTAKFMKDFRQRACRIIRNNCKQVVAELEFIQSFLNFICNFKTSHRFIQELQLGKVLHGLNSSGFPTLYSKLTDGGTKTQFPELSICLEFHHLIALTKSCKEFKWLNKNHLKPFCAVIKEYMESPTVKTIDTIPDKQVIQVEGVNVALSDVIHQLEQTLNLFAATKVVEVRFIISKTFHVDLSLNHELWHGINIVILAEKIIVHGKVQWNLSGSDGGLCSSQAAGTARDGQGELGSDGYAGESGGHVRILVEQVKSGDQLAIVSNGGNGGRGQTGGRGVDGKNGAGITINELETMFPSVVQPDKDRDVNLKTCIASLKSYDGIVEENHTFDKNNGFFKGSCADGREITLSFHHRLAGNNNQLVLFKGSHGERGRAGASGGAGGQGGFPGSVRICSLYNPDEELDFFPIARQCKSGIDGDPGNIGMHGKPGRNGWDVAYTHLWNPLSMVTKGSGFEGRKTFYGEDGNSKLFIDNGSKDDVWCNHYDKFIRITASSLFPISAECVEDNEHNETRRELPSFMNPLELSLAQLKPSVSNDDLQKLASKYVENSIGVESILNHGRQGLEKMQEELEQFVNELKEERIQEVAIAKLVRTQPNILKFGHVKQTNKKHEFKYPLSYPVKIEGRNSKALQIVTRAQLSLIVKKLKSQLQSGSYKIENDLEILAVDEMGEEGGEKIRNFLYKKSDVIKYLQLNPNQNVLSKEEERIMSSVSLHAAESDGWRTDVVNFMSPGNCELVFFENSDAQNKKQELLGNKVQLTAVWNFVMSESKKQKPDPLAVEHFEKFKSILVQDKRNSVAVANFKQALHSQQNKPALLLWLRFIKGENKEELLQKFIHEISQSEKLEACYSAYSKKFNEKIPNYTIVGAYDKEYYQLYWLHGKAKIFEAGALSPVYRELLAAKFEINLRLYMERNEVYGLQNFIQIDNHNPEAEKVLHLLYKDHDFQGLSVNWKLVQLDLRNEALNTEFGEILNAHNPWLISQSKTCSGGNMQLQVDSCKMDMMEEKYIEDITQFMKSPGKIRKALEKLKSNCIGSNEILRSICWSFILDGRWVRKRVLFCLVSDVLRSILDGVQQLHIFSCLIVTRYQWTWIEGLLMYNLERYFKGSLCMEKISDWQMILSETKNKNVLYLLRKRLIASITQHQIIDINYMDTVLRLIKDIPDESEMLKEIRNLALLEWHHYLREWFLSERIWKLVDWVGQEDRFKETCYYTMVLDNQYGILLENFLSSLDNIMIKEFEIMKNQNDEVDSSSSAKALYEILANFYSERWDITSVEMATIEQITTFHELKNSLEAKFLNRARERQYGELVEIIKSKAKKLNPLFAHFFCSIESMMKGRGKKVKEGVVNINIEEEIRNKIHDYIEDPLDTDSVSIYDNSKWKWIARVKEMLELVDVGIQIKTGLNLRDTQKLTVLYLLTNSKNTLAEVATGEGKSLIVLCTAIMRGLLEGSSIDIITTSAVLAKRDAEEYKEVYDLFGFKVSHNCKNNPKDRNNAYTMNRVVYGDLATFQRDYLLSEFEGMDIREGRRFSTVIVDEVDSLFLDKGNNVLYLSRDIPGLDTIESVYYHIWYWVNMPGVNFSVHQIQQWVVDEIFNHVCLEDLKKLDPDLSPEEVNTLWKRLIDSGIIEESGRFGNLNETDAAALVEATSLPIFAKIRDRIRFLLNKIAARERRIVVQNNLKGFVELHLDSWIRSAIFAINMHEGEDYVVDVDRTGRMQDRFANIVILDKDTGVDQGTSEWDEALHQFLQMKHGRKLSLQSLKSVFVSNASYFAKYKKLYGLTGTLGSIDERNILQQVHKFDFVSIPTAKPKLFFEALPLLCDNKEDWLIRIFRSTEQEIARGRSVLIIAETVNEVDTVASVFRNSAVAKSGKLHVYRRDYEEFEIVKEGARLKPGVVAISTNLAGRGTDIKIDPVLSANGGLHVCLTYFPKSSRVEKQSFGRAARCGEKGSGQMIISHKLTGSVNNNNIIQMRKDRELNELSRLRKSLDHYNNQILREEQYFKKFRNEYVYFKSRLLEPSNKIPLEVSKIVADSCLDSWAFWLDSKNVMGKGKVSMNKQKWEASFEKLIEKFHRGDERGPGKREGRRAPLPQVISEFFVIRGEGLEDKPPLDLEQVLHWIYDCPVRSLQLGKYYLSINNFEVAIRVFHKVIEAEDHFSAAAHYYTAFSLLKSFFGKEKGMKKLRTNIFQHMQVAESRFKSRIQLCMVGVGMVQALKYGCNNDNLFQISPFLTQQQNITSLYTKFLDSAWDMFGHEVSPATLRVHKDVTPEIAIELVQQLIARGILSKPKVTDWVTEAVYKLSLSYASLPISLNQHNILQRKVCKSVKRFLEEFKDQGVNSIAELNQQLKSSGLLYSREYFWERLLAAKILREETTYVLVELERWKKLDPITYAKVELSSGTNLKTFSSLVHEGHTNIFYFHENVPSLKQEEFEMFPVHKLMEQLEEDELKNLEEQCIFTIHKTAKLNIDRLRNNLDDISFGAFDSISFSDFEEVEIPTGEIQNIIEYLLHNKVLRLMNNMGTGNRYSLGDEGGKCLENITFPDFSLYENVVNDLMIVNFAYRLALIQLQLNLAKIGSNGDGAAGIIILPFHPDPCSLLALELVSCRLITPITVTNSDMELSKGIAKAIKNIPAIHHSDNYKEISWLLKKVLYRCRSVVNSSDTKSLCQIKLVPLRNVVTEHVFSYSQEILMLELNGLDAIIQGDQNSFYSLYWKSAIVFAIGGAQMATAIPLALAGQYIDALKFVKWGMADIFVSAKALATGKKLNFREYFYDKVASIGSSGPAGDFRRFLPYSVHKLEKSLWNRSKSSTARDIVRVCVQKQLELKCSRVFAMIAVDAENTETAIQVFLGSMSRNISLSIMCVIDSFLHRHKIRRNIEKLYYAVGHEKSFEMLSTWLTFNLVHETLLVEWSRFASRTVTEILDLLEEAAQVLCLENSNEKIQGKVENIISLVEPGIENAVDVGLVGCVAEKIFNSLDNILSITVSKTKGKGKSEVFHPEGASTQSESKRMFQDFLQELLSKWRVQLLDKMNPVLYELLTFPIAEQGGKILAGMTTGLINTSVTSVINARLQTETQKSGRRNEAKNIVLLQQHESAEQEKANNEAINEEAQYMKVLIEIIHSGKGSEALRSEILKDLEMNQKVVDAEFAEQKRNLKHSLKSLEDMDGLHLNYPMNTYIKHRELFDITELERYVQEFVGEGDKDRHGKTE